MIEVTIAVTAGPPHVKETTVWEISVMLPGVPRVGDGLWLERGELSGLAECSTVVEEVEWHPGRAVWLGVRVIDSHATDPGLEPLPDDDG